MSDKFRETGPQLPDINRESLKTQLSRLLEWHEQAAKHIRQVLEIMEYPVSGIPEMPSNRERHESAADEDRGQGSPSSRERTAALLASYSHTVPGPRVPEGGILIRHGYLAKKGEGWVRTRKAFHVEG